MKKRIMTMIFMGTLALSIGGCGNDVPEERGDSTNTESETVQGSELPEEIDDSTGAESENARGSEVSEEVDDSEDAFSFSDLGGIEFWFASGAGGWSTTMTVEDDGSFSGVYSDHDMGGANYPNGEVYFCAFSGRFAEPVQVTPYSYMTSIESMDFENLAGTEEIKDGTHYIYTEPYGLDEAKDIIIYLPGMPVADLPEGYLSWVGSDLYISYEPEEKAEFLPFYGLYNVIEGEGFSSYNVIDRLKENIAFVEDEAASLEDSIRKDSLTQEEYNEKTKELYEVWDYALNSVWSRLQQTLDEEAMNALTVEEREWIASKEKAVEEAGAEFEGGSMQPMIMYQKAAELTKARVYELLELLE